MLNIFYLHYKLPSTIDYTHIFAGQILVGNKLTQEFTFNDLVSSKAFVDDRLISFKEHYCRLHTRL